MFNGKKVIAIIPAREGSKGVVDKNIKILGNKPLVAWPIDVAKKSKYIDRIIVSTDGKKIQDIALSYGAEIIKRPKSLAQDNSLVIDTIKYTINVLKEQIENIGFIIILEATSPFRNIDDVDSAIELLVEYDSVATFVEASLNPHRAWKIEGNQVSTFLDGVNPWLPRQKLPTAYQLNGAVYAFRIDGLNKDSVSLLFGNMAAIIMPEERSLDIDNEMDFLIAEVLIKEQKNV
jgi:N-acylneuraminate cytidylyltransferase